MQEGAKIKAMGNPEGNPKASVFIIRQTVSWSIGFLESPQNPCRNILSELDLRQKCRTTLSGGRCRRIASN